MADERKLNGSPSINKEYYYYYYYYYYSENMYAYFGESRRKNEIRYISIQK